MLESGWHDNERVSCLGGELTIRESLTLAQHCDLMLGPETGVMNGVAFETVPKVLLLSHSSVNNLSRDWTNTESLTPANTPCYPCHRLHYSREFCPEDKETGAAACAADIHPSLVWDAVQRAFVGWGTVRSLIRGTA